MTDDTLRETLRANLLRLWMWRAESVGASAAKRKRLQRALRSLLVWPLVSHGGLRFSDTLPEARLVTEFFPEGPPGLAHDRELASVTLLPDHVALAASLIVGDSPAICAAKEIALRLAPTAVPVLITGETGTGKELFAQLIHRASHVSSGPFVSVNCAAVPEPLLHAELFGYEAGAFTGAAPHGRQGKMEAARNGTLFLDEVGDLSSAGQAALLRFLDSGEIQKIGRSRPTHVRARLICATHCDLTANVAEDRFRPDLFYRIALVSVPVPPLRERRDDLSLLVSHFLRAFRLRYRRDHPETVSPDALRRLKSHSWPGNVRELIFTLERAFLLCREPQITAAHLSLGETTRMARSTSLEAAIIERLSLARPVLFRDRKRWASYLVRHVDRDLVTGDVAREFELSEASVRIRLAALVQLGVLSARGVKKGRKYRLCLPVDQQ
ncbi:MAG: sigma 54-interacting transcriptional regulator [bacterium]|nr:sigma 54-interacting transcriptional regulator [bacterium]